MLTRIASMPEHALRMERGDGWARAMNGRDTLCADLPLPLHTRSMLLIRKNGSVQH